MEGRKWTDVEPEDCSPVDYPVSKQLSTDSSGQEILYLRALQDH